MHFLGVLWDNTTHTPSLKYRDQPNDGEEKYYPLEYGEPLSIRILLERRCIGHYDPPSYARAPCRLNTNVLGADIAQCALCRAKDATHFLPIDFLSLEQKESLRQLHYFVYLNVFGDDLIKVGVAAEPRKYIRLLEQGAFASIIFAEGDGYSTRVVEDNLSRVLKIRQAVNWNTKIQRIGNIITDDQAHAILRGRCEEIRRIVTSHFQGKVQPMNEYHYFLHAYNLPLPSDITYIHYVSEFLPNDVVGGTLIGVYGEVLLLQTANHGVYAVQSKGIMGYSVEVGDSAKIALHAAPQLIRLTEEEKEEPTLF